jgi:dTMP kinase
MSGKLIVIEGTDAVGKATQSELLAKRLMASRKDVEIINFPTYESEFGRLIKRYLAGELGDIHAFPPEVISMLYALDRYQYAQKLQEKLETGEYVICNRYSQSNLYQAAKIPAGKNREDFSKWFFGLESRLPAADCVVFLNLPPKVSRKLLIKRGGKIDLHEQDLRYQEAVRKLYVAEAKKRGWVVIECSEGGKLKSKEKIASEIFTAIAPVLGL